jgi:hypothetical protein
MNMKNNLINWKFLLLQIIYSMICITLIRHFMAFRTITYNDFKKRNSEIAVTPSPYTIAHSNKSAQSTTLPSNNNRVPTLSRGYTEEFNRNPTKKMESYNYNDELYALKESALIDSYYIKKARINSNSILPKKMKVLNSHLPAHLMYKKVDVTNLKKFLKSRNSLLAEEPYFLTILSVCEDFNLNPLVMFAITGQEQSFVPKSNQNALKIANNPFNVFNSWRKYNTNIEDSTTIAARTIVNLSKNRPNNIDAFTWINRKYSEDEDWSKAIRSIFKQLERNVSYCK